MNLLPPHLRPLAGDPAREDGLLTVTLRCPCGCTRFRLEEAVPSEAEQAAIDEWRAADAAVRRWRIVRLRRGERGKMVLMCRRFPFGRWVPLSRLLPERPCCMDVFALRGVCCSCGETHLLFDSRLHGMDALNGAYADKPMQWQPCWRDIPLPAGSAVRVEIYHDAEMTEADYRQFIPGYTPDMYCEAFGYIEVWSEAEGQPDRLLFESI